MNIFIAWRPKQLGTDGKRYAVTRDRDLCARDLEKVLTQKLCYLPESSMFTYWNESTIL